MDKKRYFVLTGGIAGTVLLFLSITELSLGGNRLSGWALAWLIILLVISLGMVVASLVFGLLGFQIQKKQAPVKKSEEKPTEQSEE